jgi:colanic acid biosynthesis glycosyl transferase WcaI
MKPALVAASAGLPNVQFLPLQPFERLGQLLGLADIHLLPQSPDASDLVLPSKLSGMLASGRPVVATCPMGTEIAMTVAQCGRVVPAEDAPALAAAIQQLIDDEPARRALGAQARLYAEQHLSRDAVLGRMAAAMAVPA